MKIALVSCTAKKRDLPSKAKDLYISPLFQNSLKYAQKLNADKIYILSAKYGLLDIDKIVAPYNETLNGKPVAQRKQWAEKVLKELEKVANLKNDEFIILAGRKYCEFIVPHLMNVKQSLEKLSIGKRLKYLKENI